MTCLGGPVDPIHAMRSHPKPIWDHQQPAQCLVDNCGRMASWGLQHTQTLPSAQNNWDHDSLDHTKCCQSHNHTLFKLWSFTSPCHEHLALKITPYNLYRHSQAVSWGNSVITWLLACLSHTERERERERERYPHQNHHLHIATLLCFQKINWV